MKITYLDDDYELIYQSGDLLSVYLTFAKRDAIGVSLVSIRYNVYAGGLNNTISYDWMWLPYMTLEDLKMQKDRTTHAAQK